MPRYPPVAEVVERIKKFCPEDFKSVAETLAAAIAKKDAELAHYNVRSGASACLRVAMVYARHGGDFATAKQWCSRGADYADTLTQMARQGLDGTPWSGLYVLYCSLIAGKFDKAEAVAQWMSQCAVAEDAADPHDPLPMLSAYGVLDQLEKFETYRRERFDTSWHATHPFFGPLSVYLDLWHAILKRDQAAFDAAMVCVFSGCSRR